MSRAGTQSDLSGLLGKLEARTRAEIDARRENARVEVARLAREAAQARDDRRDQMIRECVTSVERETSAMMSVATLDGRRAVLDAQHSLVDRVFSVARARLSSLTSETRLSDVLLAQRLGDALSYVAGGAPVIRCRRELARRVQQLLESNATGASVVVDEDAGNGLRITDSDGRLTIDDTLEMRLARSRSALAIEICRMAEHEPEEKGTWRPGSISSPARAV
jgi:vacuolar-type H+-ATPase subunit E/Vma4